MRTATGCIDISRKWHFAWLFQGLQQPLVTGTHVRAKLLATSVIISLTSALQSLMSVRLHMDKLAFFFLKKTPAA